MSTRLQNTILALAVVIVLSLAWVRSSAPRSAAFATDAQPASATADGCGCCGKTPSEPEPVLSPAHIPSPGEDLAETARMHRMSANLLKPQLQLTPDAAASLRAQWAERFRKQTNPLLRQEVITEMTQLDDALTLDTMLGLFESESHPAVRDQIILIVGYMRSTDADMPKVCEKLMSAYDRHAGPAERARMLDIISNIPAAESVAFMRTAFTSPRSSAEDRFNAAAGLFKLSPRMAVDAGLMQRVSDSLKHVAQSSPSVQERCRAVGVLAAAGQDNKAVLRTLLASERDPELRKFLELAAEEQPTR